MTTTVREQVVSSHTHYGCKSAATDYMERAKTELSLSTDLAYRVHSLAEKTIVVIGLILACSLIGTFLGAHFSAAAITTLLEPVMLQTFQGIAVVLSIAVPTILYNVYQRSSHLSEARNCEQIAINANIKAAETFSWKNDYGWVTGLLGRLFSLGMYNTQNGSMNYQEHRSYHVNY